MKRFFILASAAIVALASCAKTQVVYKDAPQEIAFKALNDVMTKADALGDEAYTEMNVYAFDANHANFFTEGWVSFAPKTAGAAWTAETPRYWPVEGALDFIYYAPKTQTAIAAYDSGYKLTADLTNAKDFIYGTEVSHGTKTSTSINAVLRHALSKIEVSVTADLEGIIVSSVTLTDVAVSGKAIVNYAGTDSNETSSDERLSWENKTTANIALLKTSTLAANTRVSELCYVIPCDQKTLVLTYTLPGSTPQTYTHTLSSAWHDGHKYTYNITIGANEIKFATTEKPWDEIASTEIVIDPNDTNN